MMKTGSSWSNSPDRLHALGKTNGRLGNGGWPQLVSGGGGIRASKALIPAGDFNDN